MLGASIHIGTVEAAGTVYIRADGSIDPPTTPISSTNNVTYTFDSNITDSIVVQKSNITIDGNWYTLQGAGSGNGFYLFGIDNVTIERTNIKDFDYGICLDSSSHNTLTENSISAGFYGYGILLGNSAGFNDVIRNNVTDNKYGIVLNESSILNSLAENDVSNNEIGIWLQESDLNNISRNSISNNHCGIYLEQTVHNNISHNSLSNNSLQAQSDEISTDIWDGGYPSGGNYWSDYGGSDLYWGPGQNVTGSDGIGDAPYVIDGNNSDGYPLMSPWAPPDVATTNLTASKLFVGQGYGLRLNGTVANLGSKVEGFNVSVLANSTLIDSPYVVLTMQNSTTMSLSWNTTGFSYGNYTLSAYAWPVPGETNLLNNNLTGSTVLVTIPGDAADPFLWVTSKDLTYLLGAYGTRPYNPNADITDDGDLIGSKDLTILLKYFGKHYP
jgi:parallel beta-helix repeat protein